MFNTNLISLLFDSATKRSLFSAFIAVKARSRMLFCVLVCLSSYHGLHAQFAPDASTAERQVVQDQPALFKSLEGYFSIRANQGYQVCVVDFSPTILDNNKNEVAVVACSTIDLQSGKESIEIVRFAVSQKSAFRRLDTESDYAQSGAPILATFFNHFIMAADPHYRFEGCSMQGGYSHPTRHCTFVLK